MIRLLPLLLALAGSLAAQSSLQLSTVTASGENVFSAFLDLGSAAVGDALDTRVRIRNTGTASVVLSQIAVKGNGYTLNGMPALPYPLAAQAFVDVTIRLTPASTGPQTASLAVNTSVTVLQAVGVGTIMLYLDQSGRRTLLPNGSRIDLGSVARGSSGTVNVVAVNGATQPLKMNTIVVSGDGFQLGGTNPAPVTLNPRQELILPLVFAPNKTQQFSGTLQIDNRSWPLAGTMTEPVFPPLQLSLSSQTASSAQQAKLTVSLASPAPQSASGRVKLDFKPLVAGVAADSTIQFLAGSSPSLSFLINQGETTAKFGTLAEAIFQTGTTAGTITITAQLGTMTQTASMTIAPAPPYLDSIVATRTGSQIEVIATGYDNSLSASQLSFVFYDKNGVTFTAAPILYNASGDFKQFFATSTLGGTFQLRAVFPITGDPGQIRACDMQISNSIGTTRSTQTSIPGPGPLL